MRRSVSSPDETTRRELKIRRAAEYFWRTSRCFIWWWNTASNVWYFFSTKIIFEGEIKDAKMSSFSSDIQTLIKHYFPLNFLYELLMSLRIMNHNFGEHRVAQWWKHSPPTNVARVQIPASTPYVGWVCCWFSPLLWEVFLRVLRFSPLLKNQHF